MITRSSASSSLYHACLWHFCGGEVRGSGLTARAASRRPPAEVLTRSAPRAVSAPTVPCQRRCPPPAPEPQTGSSSGRDLACWPVPLRIHSFLQPVFPEHSDTGHFSKGWGWSPEQNGNKSFSYGVNILVGIMAKESLVDGVCWECSGGTWGKARAE